MTFSWNLPSIFRYFFEDLKFTFYFPFQWLHWNLKHIKQQSLFPERPSKAVTCLATDACLIADPGVVSSARPGPILSWRLIQKCFLQSFSSLPLNHSIRVVVSNKRKYGHKVLVNRLFELAQEKSVVRWIDHPTLTIAVDWDINATNKQTNGSRPICKSWYKRTILGISL